NKDDGVTQVTAGDGVTYTYTIRVDNDGPFDAENVMVADTWPTEFDQGTTVTPSQGTCTAGPNFSCSLGAIAVNGFATITATYTVAADEPAKAGVTNTVTVNSDTPDSDPSNNSATDINEILTDINLTIVKIFDPDEVLIGSTNTFTLEVSNAGPSDAVAVSITDLVDDQLTVLSVTSADADCTASSGQMVDCTVDIPAGSGSVLITVEYLANSPVPDLPDASSFGTIDGAEVIFEFVNGYTLTGSTRGTMTLYDENGVDVFNYQSDEKNNLVFDPPPGVPLVGIDDPAFELHLSCSDSFTGGWGSSNGPEEGVDVNWQIASFDVNKYDGNGELNKSCGATPGISMVDNTATVLGEDSSTPVDTDESTDTLTVIPCDVCDGGVTDLTFEYQGVAPAMVQIYDKNDNSDASKLLFGGMVNPGDEIVITKLPGEDKFNNDVSIYVDGVFHRKFHTSCSKPIGPGQILGDFEIISGTSVNNGRMCPLDVCNVQGGLLETYNQEFRMDVTNSGDLNVVIEKITITWPAANGALIEVKREGDTIHEGDFAYNALGVVIDSGWKGDINKRAIKPGDTDTLKFKFENDAANAEYSILVEFESGCSVEFSGELPGPPFACNKPIDQLTMIWGGSSDIKVTAWKGSVGSTMLADMVPVSVDGELSVSGYAGSPNDVFWEIFDANTNSKLGESKYHLSCSDGDMDGPEDCGKLQGNGKDNDSSLINTWILEGMVDSESTLDC
ncbi:MAG: DUF11 domain-containing protein, partial [Gammaproteobacteria bacterium]|nr:DUF11 domain-containing protein [Gammaproteobacteria bacterium]